VTVLLRHPTRDDAPAACAIVRESEVLDPNSPYAYVATFEHFGSTCAVAESNGVVVAFVSAYRLPARPDVLFVWQVGVRAEARGCGLATSMLLWLLSDTGGRPRMLETTVTPSNTASRRLFLGLARHLRAACVVEAGFPPELLGAGHEPEELFRIGPIDRSPS
jgi:L-2,4-diaminobutyric acid acetyltransferase